jgi:regulator of extracellular matrix RemA (YlzA/DUF370 family)
VPDLQLAVAERRLVAIVAARQGPLKPAIKDDEQVTRTHLLDAQFGNARFAVLPRIRQNRIAIAAHDAFERQLNGQVEVMRQQRLDAGRLRMLVASLSRRQHRFESGRGRQLYQIIRNEGLIRSRRVVQDLANKHLWTRPDGGALG